MTELGEEHAHLFALPVGRDARVDCAGGGKAAVRARELLDDAASRRVDVVLVEVGHPRAADEAVLARKDGEVVLELGVLHLADCERAKRRRETTRTSA